LAGAAALLGSSLRSVQSGAQQQRPAGQ
jgi:hypothetical protein